MLADVIIINENGVCSRAAFSVDPV
jgi:hypothetical protein